MTMAETLAVAHSIKDSASRSAQLLIYADNVSRHAAKQPQRS